MKHLNDSSPTQFNQALEGQETNSSNNTDEFFNSKSSVMIMKTIAAWTNTFPRQFASFVLFQNGTGVVFLNKHLKKLSLEGDASTLRELLGERALQLLKHQGCLSGRQVISTRVNRLRNASGWMVQFDSPYILTFVNPHPDIDRQQLLEQESIKSISQLAFETRNIDAMQLKIVYIQDNSHYIELP